MRRWRNSWMKRGKRRKGKKNKNIEMSKIETRENVKMRTEKDWIGKEE